MNDFVILGTDTDAGKTTFAALWLAAFPDDYDYWKPLETGVSDSATIRRLVPGANVHAPLLAFAQPVAPLLAARAALAKIPPALLITAERPTSPRHLLIETFGSPFSPLNEMELQIILIDALEFPCVLVTSTAVGAVGRCIQCLRALEAFSLATVLAVVLVGENDPFALEQIACHAHSAVYCIQPPASWDASAVAAAATAARPTFEAIRKLSGVRTRPESINTFPTHQVVARDRQTVWHPYTSLGDTAAPLNCIGAQDEFLRLANGRRVIDAISSWWTILLGHRHPVLMAALLHAAQRFDHVLFAGVTHEPAVELAEFMLATMPWQDGRVFYSDNGSTAVEAALKMAYQFWCHRGEPGRTRFVGFEGGYHGDTFGAMAVSRDPVFFGRFEPLLCQASIVPLSAEHLESALTLHDGKVAAVIIEPLVQGSGGMRMHSPAVLRDLAEVARRHDVLLIADEVMTGSGRTGTLWAHQAAAIVPDIICAGKTLAGGVLPLAATLAAPHVVAAFQTADASKTFFHGHSFTAHPLACAVAAANWRTLVPAAPALARRQEAFWQQALTPLRELPHVRDVRVRGSIAAVELAVPGGYLATVGRRIRAAALERDVLLRPLGNVVYAMAPLLAETDSLERIAEVIRTVVTQGALD